MVGEEEQTAVGLSASDYGVESSVWVQFRDNTSSKTYFWKLDRHVCSLDVPVAAPPPQHPTPFQPTPSSSLSLCLSLLPSLLPPTHTLPPPAVLSSRPTTTAVSGPLFGHAGGRRLGWC